MSVCPSALSLQPSLPSSRIPHSGLGEVEGWLSSDRCSLVEDLGSIPSIHVHLQLLLQES